MKMQCKIKLFNDFANFHLNRFFSDCLHVLSSTSTEIKLIYPPGVDVIDSCIPSKPVGTLPNFETIIKAGRINIAGKIFSDFSFVSTF